MQASVLLRQNTCSATSSRASPDIGTSSGYDRQTNSPITSRCEKCPRTFDHELLAVLFGQQSLSQSILHNCHETPNRLMKLHGGVIKASFLRNRPFVYCIFLRCDLAQSVLSMGRRSCLPVVELLHYQRAPSITIQSIQPDSQADRKFRVFAPKIQRIWVESNPPYNITQVNDVVSRPPDLS